MKTCDECALNSNRLDLCYLGGKQKQINPTDPACDGFRQRCERCDEFDALMQEWAEYHPFKPSYMKEWLGKLFELHLKR